MDIPPPPKYLYIYKSQKYGCTCVSKIVGLPGPPQTALEPPQINFPT